MTIRGIIFDRDDTLTYGFMHPELEGQPLPGVVDLLAQLRNTGVSMAVATNQAGPLYAHFQEEIIQANPWWKKRDYPSTEQVAQQLAHSMQILGINDIPLFVAVYDPRVTTLVAGRGVFPIEQAKVIAYQMKMLLCDMGINAHVGWQPSWRKPETGMVDTIAQDFWGVSPRSAYQEIAYVGDMHTGRNGEVGSDLATAHNAGMTFVKAEEIQSLLSLVV